MFTSSAPARDLSASRLFCLGLGYCARRLAARVITAGGTAAGTSRESSTREALSQSGIEAVDFSLAAGNAKLDTATDVVVSAPPGESGCPVLKEMGEAIAAMHNLSWLAYLSTTGVYGDCGGAWVDEAAEARPGNARSRRRVAAEEAWRAWARRYGLPLVIFRISGIYGPGRSAFDQLRAGRARRVVKPGHVFSRIHVDDVAGALAASMQAPGAGDLFNLADDEPAPQADVVAYAARLLGLEAPPEIPFAEVEMSEMAASFWRDSRRVSNRRLKEILAYRPLYPSYREGLAAILAEERQS